MKSEKTGLTKYVKDGNESFAARITGISELPRPIANEPFARTLHFGDLGKVAHVQGWWITAFNPQVGGYFVVSDHEHPKGVYIEPRVFEKEWDLSMESKT